MGLGLILRVGNGAAARQVDLALYITKNSLHGVRLRIHFLMPI
jgi:hypothetical protein